MSYQSAPKEVTARKAHGCSWCGQAINKGEKYESTFIVFEGDAWKRKLHLERAEANRAYDYDGEPLYYEGQFQRGHNHEHNFDTVERCAKDDCPACIRLLSQPICEKCNGGGATSFDGDAHDCDYCDGTGRAPLTTPTKA